MRQKFGELTESTHIISNWMQYNSEGEPGGVVGLRHTFSTRTDVSLDRARRLRVGEARIKGTSDGDDALGAGLLVWDELVDGRRRCVMTPRCEQQLVGDSALAPLDGSYLFFFDSRRWQRTSRKCIWLLYPYTPINPTNPHALVLERSAVHVGPNSAFRRNSWRATFASHHSH